MPERAMTWKLSSQISRLKATVNRWILPRGTIGFVVSMRPKARVDRDEHRESRCLANEGLDHHFGGKGVAANSFR